MALVIRNTFFEVADEAKASDMLVATAKIATRRSTSVPCEWRPLATTKDADGYGASDASTSASNCDDSERNWGMSADWMVQPSTEVSPVFSSMGEWPLTPGIVFAEQHKLQMEYFPEAPEINQSFDTSMITQAMEQYQAQNSMIAGGLVWTPPSFEPQNGPFPSVMGAPSSPFSPLCGPCGSPCNSFDEGFEAAPQRSRLKSSASSFTPASSPQGECATVIGAAKIALLNCPNVTNVKADDCQMGSLTTIVAETLRADGADTKKVLNLIKTSLLQAAADSSNAYVLGYTQTPFKDLLGCGFKATIGVVRPECADSVCWDTYQKGFCPRRATCRWVHPEDSELMNLRVVIKQQSSDGH